MRLLYTGMGLIVIMTAMAADRVTLKDGRVIGGTYLGGSAREVRIDAGDKIQTLIVADIESISFGGAQQGTVAALYVEIAVLQIRVPRHQGAGLELRRPHDLRGARCK
jgi:hypothetical protein